MSERFVKPTFWVKVGRILFGQGFLRIHGINASTTLPCERCGYIWATTESEIWYGNDARGRLRRYCRECGECCAAG